MLFDLPPGPFAGVFTSDGDRDGRAAMFRRALSAGVIRRVRAGAFVDAAVWESAGRRERTLLVIRAVCASRRFRDVVSHESAAALHGLRLLTEPSLVHFTSSSARSTRSRSGVVWHAAPLEPQDVIHIPPFRATSLTRTLADMAMGSSFAQAVTSIDGALAAAVITRDGLRASVEAAPRQVGRRSALRAVEFADAGAANGGESLSRVVVDQLGFVAPTLQEPFRDAEGLIGYVDLWWEGVGVAGEFDGFQKYSKPEYLRGRSPSQVVVEEKTRERRLEAVPRVRGVARWVWRDATEAHRLHAILVAVGVPKR